MLINQHDTSWQNDLPTRVDEVGNFLIYILHGGYMHNLIAQVETAFDVPRLQRRMLTLNHDRHTPDFHNGSFVSLPDAELLGFVAARSADAQSNDYYL